TDHGESFNDNGANYWGHGSSFSQYQVKVPLILYVPDRKPAQYEYRTSHIDIAPTLLREYFGCSSDFDIYSSGGSLFDEQTSPRSLVINSYVNYAYVFGEDVYEIWPTHTRKHKLHDVNEKASPLDPTLLKGIVEKLNRFMDD
ncbi:MAG TPA: sulfatase-like hydrolase/transferase, partial [Candidatus Krumholzibacterium sp.]|nr:sulfatase-like hydrolase/transferase [Candidatus Krumholzibacterium sp.]